MASAVIVDRRKPHPQLLSCADLSRGAVRRTSRCEKTDVHLNELFFYRGIRLRQIRRNLISMSQSRFQRALNVCRFRLLDGGSDAVIAKLIRAGVEDHRSPYA